MEPMDEFIREVADFIHHMINTRPDGPGQVEVEAKIGILKDKMSGKRIQMPILVESSKLLLNFSLAPFEVYRGRSPHSLITKRFGFSLRIQHDPSEDPHAYL